MCLAIPGRVLSVEEGALRMGRVSFGGIVKKVCLEYVPDAAVDDYVIVHVGFAISRLDEAEAHSVFAYLEQLGEIAELGTAGAAADGAEEQER